MLLTILLQIFLKINIHIPNDILVNLFIEKQWDFGLDLET